MCVLRHQFRRKSILAHRCCASSTWAQRHVLLPESFRWQHTRCLKPHASPIFTQTVLDVNAVLTACVCCAGDRLGRAACDRLSPFHQVRRLVPQQHVSRINASIACRQTHPNFPLQEQCALRQRHGQRPRGHQVAQGALLLLLAAADPGCAAKLHGTSPLAQWNLHVFDGGIPGMVKWIAQ
jgi:hypothetical protein